jgi:addiction module HigA family antidote
MERHRDIEPTHPGEILREDVLPALRKSQTEIAKLLHVSRQTLHAILSEKAPITPRMAVKIGKLCGNGPELWVNLQAAYDLWHAKREVKTDDIPTLEAVA